MRRLVLFALLVAVSSGFTRLDTVRLRFFNVEKLGADLVVSWQAEAEADVEHYEIWRQTPYISDRAIATVPCHGAERLYRYVDSELYKAAGEQVSYRLMAVLRNGVRQQVSADISLEYTPTAVRRTWGSIKAMFQ